MPVITSELIPEHVLYVVDMAAAYEDFIAHQVGMERPPVHYAAKVILANPRALPVPAEITGV